MTCSCCHPTRRGVLVAALSSVATRAHAAPWVEPVFQRAAPGKGGPRKVALTLDACPGGFDRRIADVLIEKRIKATIFLTARWIEHNRDPLKVLLDHPDLFAFENHGARHVPPILGTDKMYGLAVAGTLDSVTKEVEDGAKAIRDATGTEPGWYRGAAARYSPEAIAAIRDLGFRIAAYSLSADQGASLPAAQVAKRLNGVRDGDVVIGHINQPRRASGAGLAAGIAALKDVEFVHLDALDPRLAPPPKTGRFDRRPTNG